MSARIPLAPDSAVPQLETMLDGRQMRELLARHAGMAIRAVEPVKIKYRVGHSLRVVYRVQTPTETVLMAARTLAVAASRDDAPQTVGGDTASGASSWFAVPELGARVWAFPADRRLAGVHSLLGPSPAIVGCLDGWVGSRLAGYAPEKSVVVECLDGAGRTLAFAKQYASRAEATTACRLHRAVADAAPGDPLRLPRVLAADAACNVVFTEAASGERVSEFDAAAGGGDLGPLGAAVAALHEVPPPTWAPAPVRFTSGSIREAGEVVGRAVPSAARSVARLAFELADRVPAATTAVTLHGDLHLKNALFDGNAVWLIDLDQAARGGAEADLGSFVALLRSHGSTGTIDPHTALLLERSFLAGYAARRPLPESETLEWHVAAALLTERAARAVTRVRLPILARMDLLVDAAHRAIRKAGVR